MLLLLIVIGQLSIFMEGTLSPLLFYPPDTYLDLSIGALIYYLQFYLLGALLYSNQQLVASEYFDARGVSVGDSPQIQIGSSINYSHKFNEKISFKRIKK